MPRRENRPHVLDIADVLEPPGVRHHHHLAGPLPGIATSVAHVPSDADVEVELTLEAITGAAQGAAVTVEGVASARWEGECRRCLGPTTGRLHVAFHELYARQPTDSETFPLVDEELDLGPMLRQWLTLQLPLAPLCAEDCPGPAPDTHPVGRSDEPSATDAGSSDVSADVSNGKRDPRWAILDQIRFD